MKLLLDEMISPMVAQRLRERGCDALAVSERGTRSGTDSEQMVDAVSDRRAVVTYNIDDFVALVDEYAAASRPHFGVILVSERTIRQSDLGGIVRALDAFCQSRPAEDALMNQCVYLRI